MSDSFTTYWSNDRCKTIKKYHLEGLRLNLLFGGPHTSLPSFRRAGVQEGDYIYPIRVYQGDLYVIGRMRARQILTLEEYIQINPYLFEKYKTHWPSITFINYLVDHPEMGYLAPTCVEEVILGEEGTTLSLENAIPPQVVEGLRFRSQKKERGIKHLENGKITKVLSLQGNYRLARQSASELKAWVDRANASTSGTQLADPPG